MYQHTSSGSATARPTLGPGLRAQADAAAPPARPAPSEDRLLGAAFRAPTLGMVGLVSLIALEALAVATVMPRAATDLRGLSLYGLLFGGPLAASLLGMVAAGRWSDRHGPLPPLWGGVAGFVSGLIVGGLAPSMSWLVAGRLVAGLGSGMLSVALYALVGRLYPAALHARVFTAFSAAWVLPSLIGPALGGLVADALGWRWTLLGVALLTLPAAAMLKRIAPVRPAQRHVPHARDRPRRLLWALGAAAAALTLHYVGQRTAGDPTPGTMISTAAWLMPAALVLLLLSARRLLPPGSLAARAGLPAAIALNGLAQAAFFATEAFLPLLLFRERGLSVGMAGLVLSAGAVSWSASAACRGAIGTHTGTAGLLRLGMTLLALGIALSATAVSTTTPVVLAVAGWVVAGAGMGLISPTLSVLTLALSPPDRQGDTGAALRLSAALSTTAALAAGGLVFAQLLPVSPQAAYLGSLGFPAALAVLGAVIAGRATEPVPIASDAPEAGQAGVA